MKCASYQLKDPRAFKVVLLFQKSSLSPVFYNKIVALAPTYNNVPIFDRLEHDGKA